MTFTEEAVALKRWTLFALAVALICTAPVAAAQRQRDEATSAPRKMAPGDEKFLMKTAQHGKAEVELGRLASEKGSAPAAGRGGTALA